MHRRQFMITSAIVFAGSLLGLHRLAPVHAAALSDADDGPKLALIIDDIGFSRSVAQRFLDLKIPITFSILPRLPLSAPLAWNIHKLGHEVMLHQPMEPLQSKIDPGPGALFMDDSHDRIARTLADNIAGLPFASGANNHMGSRFTQDPQKMNQALGEMRKRSLFFLDSLTTMRSQAFDTAQRMHMPALRRDIFLDPIADAETTYRQLCRLKRCAIVHGRAIGIGHPYAETAEGLRRFFSSDACRGVEPVHISRLVDAAS